MGLWSYLLTFKPKTAQSVVQFLSISACYIVQYSLYLGKTSCYSLHCVARYLSVLFILIYGISRAWPKDS